MRVVEFDAPAYLTDHRAACEEIDHLAWIAVTVIELVDNGDRLTPKGRATALRRVVAAARERPSVMRALSQTRRHEPLP